MKIGVLSDTHFSRKLGVLRTVAQMIRNSKTISQLDELLERHFQDVECILHAGDFVELAVLEHLKMIAPVIAVQGNMDSPELCASLPVHTIFEREGIRIGLTHGDGAPQGIVQRVLAQFQGEQLDAVVFGHSHQPLNERHSGILCFNPGSPTDRIFAPYNSIGILEITDRTITGTLVRA